MNLEFKHLLPQDFAPASKVWVYQSNRLFSIPEAMEIGDLITRFCQGWTSHGDQVKAFGHLFFGQFIVLMADESACHVGGCSTDSSIRFIKELGEKFQVDLFNRTQLAFVRKDKVEILPLAQMDYAVENGFVNADTLFFNNTVHTKQQLENNWIIPVKDSWLASRLPKVGHTA